MKKALFVILPLLILLCSILPLSVAAYVVPDSAFYADQSGTANIGFFSASASEHDGLFVIQSNYKSSYSESVMSDPKAFGDFTFVNLAVRLAAEASGSIYDCSDVGYSISSSYNASEGYFVYTVFTFIPVSEGDSFSLVRSTSSSVSLFGRNQTYFFPGVSGVRRVSYSAELSYTLGSNRQHLMFVMQPSYYSGTAVAYKSNADTHSSFSSMTNQSIVRRGYAGGWVLMSSDYDASTGSVIDFSFIEGVTTYQCSVFELYDDGTNFSGSVDIENGSDDSESEDSNIFIDVQGIIDAVLSLPETIVNGISGFLVDLFMPDTDAIAEDWAYIQEKFQWWTDLKAFIEDMVSTIAEMQDTEPDVITFELHADGTQWFTGLNGNAVAIDLSWYSKYRETVHLILSAFIWLVYIWHLWHSLPGIISGASGAVKTVGSSKEVSE